MTTIQLTYDEAVHGHEPSCIVGHVLARHGVTPEEVIEAGLNQHAVRSLVGSGLLDIDERTTRLLAEAQEYQDGGSTWGVALDYAIADTEGDPL
jgi:hypothetical protein